MTDRDKEEQEFLKKRLRELAGESAGSFSYRFSGFLSPAEASLGYAAAAEVFGRGGGNDARGISAFGGADGCERVMLRFGLPGEIGYEVPFPIRIIHAAVPEKFSDTLTHRDYLGALMNLGIKRETTGDIWIRDNAAWIFADETMAGYIAENLTRVKHTAVRCVLCDTVPPEALPKKESVRVIVPSVRLDAVLAKLLHLSRGKAKALFAQKKVFVDGKLCENDSLGLKEGNIISVRGSGKFIYRGLSGQTKKGSLVISLERYI